MKSRERVMMALRLGLPDQVPWVENDIEEGLQRKIMGGRTDYTPGELCRALGMDGFGYHFPTGAAGLAGQALQTLGAVKDAFYFPKRINFDFFPPWIADMGVMPGGRTFIKKGLLVDRYSLQLFDEYLPDPDHPARYEQVAEWLERYREDYAVFARIRLGTASTIESMGLDVFSLMLYDDPDLVKEIHRRFSEWTVSVVKNLNKLDFDFYWANDDLADNKMPWVNLEMYGEFIFPYQKMVAEAIERPWVFHSDGNLFPILDGLLDLGMDAIHPIQPAAMDIGRMKAEYGSRVCIIGNIDLDHTLTLGTPEEVQAEVKDRIQVAGRGGGYIVSSANSLTEYCRIENVGAMARAVKEYGRYEAGVAPESG